MPVHYLNIEECLFSAFAEYDYVDPQECRQMWAIQEGLSRIKHGYGEWQRVRARKKHECIRGCRIHAGDFYFKHKLGAGWTDEWKLCAGCMAMILYFTEVDKLPVVFHTHWDLQKQEPVCLEDERD